MCKYFYKKTSTSLMKRIGSNKLLQTSSIFFFIHFRGAATFRYPNRKCLEYSTSYKWYYVYIRHDIYVYIYIYIMLYLPFFIHTFVAFEVLGTVKPQRFRFITRQIYSIMTGEVIALILFLSGEIMLLWHCIWHV